jgi:hypothetical protein
MDLFDRYLNAVRHCLPRAQQDDIIGELSEELRSRVEDQEAERGRPLTTEEQEQILRQFGHPLVLAAKYQPQRHLIGSTMFPIYWVVLKLSLAAALIVHTVGAVVLLANGRPVGDVISRLVLLPLGPLLVVFAWVTVIFAVLDSQFARLPFVAHWSPSSLPDLPAQTRGPSTTHLIAEIIFATGAVLWWAAVPSNQWLLFGPAATMIEMSPAYLAWHVPILVLMAAQVALMWAALLHRDVARYRPLGRVLEHVCSIGIAVWLLRSGPLVVGKGAPEHVVRFANLIATMVLGAIILASIIELVRRALRLPGQRNAAHAAKA